MRFFSVLAAGAMLFTAACTSNVTVSAPSISPTQFASQTKTPGNYAVYLQTGGWNKEIKTTGWTCNAWSFPTNFDGAYVSAAQSAFSQSFQNVKFVPAVLPPAELRKQNFDAQIIVYQGNMGAKFGVVQGLFTGAITVDVEVEGIVAVSGHSGLASQGQARGAAHGVNEGVLGCDSASPAIQQAGGNAISDFVIEAVNAAKLNILEMKTKAAAASG